MSEAHGELGRRLSWPVRLLGLTAAWLLVYLASPGIATKGGIAASAALGVGLWGWTAARGGRGAFWLEALPACIAWCGICSWAALVHWSTLLFIGPGFGIYFAVTGVLLRRLAARWPLSVAVPAAWVGMESVRAVLMPPFGMKWMRLGTHLHDIDWLSGSARVWGLYGLSYVLAAVGGALADAAGGTGTLARPKRVRWLLAAGGGPLVLAIGLALGTRPPETEAGPRVLIVQPAIPQARKMSGLSGEEILGEGFRLTQQGLDEVSRAGEPPVDLVAWGESMLQLDLVGPGLRDAVKAGAKPPPWVREQWNEHLLDVLERVEREVVGEFLMTGGKGQPGLLPAGTAFVSGSEVWVGRGSTIGRLGAVVLWTPDGARAGAVGKLHRVPGAETMLGLERFELIRKAIFSLAGYVPDLVAHEGSRRLAFTARSGREYAFGASVCFDNAFDAPFVEPLLEGPVDFHLVASNEAWFLGDQEPDQMLAFSHLAAIETGRSIVRATNSGIGAVVDPAGKDVARLAVGGREKEVAGTLRANVPVPVAGEREARTVYVATRRFWPALALAWPVLLLVIGRRSRPGYRAPGAG